MFVSLISRQSTSKTHAICKTFSTELDTLIYKSHSKAFLVLNLGPQLRKGYHLVINVLDAGAITRSAKAKKEAGMIGGGGITNIGMIFIKYTG